MKPLINKLLSGLAPIGVSIKQRKLVLCYHRFSAPGYQDSFYNPVSTMPVVELEKQLIWLQQFADIVTLDELMNSHSDRWQVAITIDDGYRDVVDLALPVFEQLKTPVTWFIATKPVEEPRWIPWWDMSAWIKHQTNGTFSTDNQSLSGEWDLSRHEHKEQISAALRSTALFEGPLAAEQLVAEIVKHLTVPDNAFIRPDHLAEYRNSSILTIAPHTHQHPNLALLSTDEQRQEFSVSMNKLKQWNTNPQPWLAYPFGKEWARSMGTPEIARDLGFKAAFTTNIDFIEPETNSYTVPRISVDGRWNMAAFRARAVFAPIQNRIKAQLK